MKFERNPFTQQNIENRDDFVGEKSNDILNKIKNRLVSDKYANYARSFLVYGDRGVGKSSLLNILKNESKEYNAIPVFVQLNEINCVDAFTFFAVLYKRIVPALRDYVGAEQYSVLKKNIEALHNPKSELQSGEKFFSFIQTYKYLKHDSVNIKFDQHEIISDFEKLIDEVIRFDSEHRKLIFLLDDAQKIYQNKTIIEAVRSIIESQSGISFVLAGEKPLFESVINQVFGSIKRGFEKIELDAFSKPEDVEEYFKKNLKSINWGESDIDRSINSINPTKILILTHGKPDLIAQLAEAIFEDAKSRNRTKLKFTAEILSSFKEAFASNSLPISAPLNKEESIVFDFDIERVTKIQKLSNIDFLCFDFLRCDFNVSSLKSIYKSIKFLFSPSDNFTEDRFLHICNEFVTLNFFKRISLKKANTIGYTISNKASADEKTKYLYLGNSDELTYLSISLFENNRFMMRHKENINLLIIDFLSSKSINPKFVYKSSYTDLNPDFEELIFTEIDTLSYIQSMTDNKYENEKILKSEFCMLIFDLIDFNEINTVNDDIELLHIKYFNSTNNSGAYKILAKSPKTVEFKFHYCESKYEDYKLQSIDSEIDFDYKIEVIPKSQLPTVVEFSQVIANSEVKVNVKSETMFRCLKSVLDDYKDNNDFAMEKFEKIADVLKLLSKDWQAFDVDNYNMMNSYCYLLIKSGRTKEALDLLNNIYSIYSSGSIDGSLKSNSWIPYIIYNLAISCHQLKHYDEAENYFKELKRELDNEKLEIQDASWMFKIVDSNLTEVENLNASSVIELCDYHINCLQVN